MSDELWPAVSRLHDVPQIVLDEVRRLYIALRTADPDQQAVMEARIRELADRYKSLAGDA